MTQNYQKIVDWIENELERRRLENDHEPPEADSYEPGLFLNVLAVNIDELLRDKQLTFDLAQYFQTQRGLTGERWRLSCRRQGLGLHHSGRASGRHCFRSSLDAAKPRMTRNCLSRFRNEKHAS